MARSRVTGVSKLRRLLRRLPDDITDDVRKAVSTSGDIVLRDMQAVAPHKSIEENLSKKMSQDGLTARVGLIGRRANRRGFLARIIEFGAKAHQISPRGASFTAGGRRRKGKGAKAMVIGGDFVRGTVTHPGLKPRPFFFKPFQRARPLIVRRIKEAIARALGRASAGSGGIDG